MQYFVNRLEQHQNFQSMQVKVQIRQIAQKDGKTSLSIFLAETQYFAGGPRLANCGRKKVFNPATGQCGDPKDVPGW